MLVTAIMNICVGRSVGREKASDIDTAPKRARLLSRKNPYWQGVSGGRGGVSLGYRKPAGGAGTWIAKIVVAGERSEERLGLANDDGAPADALPYRVAVAAALEWSGRQHAAMQARAEAPNADREPTVRIAVEAYIRKRKKKSLVTGKDAESRLTLHVLSNQKFADAKLSKLRSSTIEDWREGLPIRDAQADDDETEHKETGEDEAPRRFLAPSTVNRLLNDLRAALNDAAVKYRRQLPAFILPEIKLGTQALQITTTTARKQILTDGQIRRVIDAAFTVDPDGDFGPLVLVMAATGARHSQIARLRVADVQAAQNRILVPGSRKGRSLRAKPPATVPVAADVIARLEPALSGRSNDEPLLMRWVYRQVGAFEWERDHRRAWGTASETDRLWKEVVAAAELPAGSVMYALRHSSIVRGLATGLPIRLVAALHDTSVTMIEAHYSAYITEATDEIARRGALQMT